MTDREWAPFEADGSLGRVKQFGMEIPNWPRDNRGVNQ
jgi:hypothetical protein